MNPNCARKAAAPPQIVILGAGPAGVGAAWQLVQRRAFRVVVLEQQDAVGGNAGSFELDGICADYGSHRLHPATSPEILYDLSRLLGSDLLRRPRHGRIRLRGRWVHFPLQPLDLLAHLPPGFLAGAAADAVRTLLPQSKNREESFANVLEHGLGRTICREFYFPYAEKLWGLPPFELAAMQAHRRVSAKSFATLLRKLAAALPGVARNGAGRYFYYPRRGYGQISEALAEAACAAGAEIRLGARVTAVQHIQQRVSAVDFSQQGCEHQIAADVVLSTLPVSFLAQIFIPSAPTEVREAACALRFRGMILVYLVLAQDRFTEFDAHYFPDAKLPISRLSEPKNYSGVAEPRGRTVLCAELPADPGQTFWQMSDAELGRAVCGWLEEAGLTVRAPVLRVVTRRLRCAYPVYRRGYEVHFARLDEWLSRFPNLVTFGRQGLFVHDNTHHALAMAYAAAQCISDKGEFDHVGWDKHRRAFEAHVVED